MSHEGENEDTFYNCEISSSYTQYLSTCKKDIKCGSKKLEIIMEEWRWSVDEKLMIDSAQIDGVDLNQFIILTICLLINSINIL